MLDSFCFAQIERSECWRAEIDFVSFASHMMSNSYIDISFFLRAVYYCWILRLLQVAAALQTTGHKAAGGKSTLRCRLQDNSAYTKYERVASIFLHRRRHNKLYRRSCTFKRPQLVLHFSVFFNFPRVIYTYCAFCVLL